MDLSSLVFRPEADAIGPACDWAMLVAVVAARQAASPTARAQARLLARATRPGGAFASRVVASLRRAEE